jgi:deazaflavin-dependent oxidoreductase (nitroreductase family)
MKRIKLTTTGRLTGQLRDVRLYAYPDGEGLVVIGSSNGGDRDPGWVHNLRALPKGTVLDGKRATLVSAEEVAGADHDRLWRLACEDFPYYDTYQRKTTRRIPVFVLRPIESGGAGDGG